jgi:hypothetical protein
MDQEYNLSGYFFPPHKKFLTGTSTSGNQMATMLVIVMTGTKEGRSMMFWVVMPCKSGGSPLPMERNFSLPSTRRKSKPNKKKKQEGPGGKLGLLSDLKNGAECWWTSTKLHSVTTQTIHFIITALGISNPK